jgi:hypothetical protein
MSAEEKPNGPQSKRTSYVAPRDPFGYWDNRKRRRRIGTAIGQQHRHRGAEILASIGRQQIYLVHRTGLTKSVDTPCCSTIIRQMERRRIELPRRLIARHDHRKDVHGCQTIRIDQKTLR